MLKNEGKVLVRNIILFVVLVVLMCVVVNNISVATHYSSLNSFINSNIYVNDTVSLGYNDLYSEGNKYLYCIQKGAVLNAALHKYSVSNKIELRGNNATSYLNGTSIQSYYNAYIAYILSDLTDSNGNDWAYGYGIIDASGNHVTTARQQTLWAHWNDWHTACGEYLGIPNYKDNNSSIPENELLGKAANHYATNLTTVQIASNVGTTIETDNIEMGPFNVTYTGYMFSIEIRDTNGNPITGNISFMQDNQIVDIINIKSGKDFYIINESGMDVRDITITVSGYDTIKNVDLYILDDITGNPTYQKLMLARPLKDTKADMDSVTINISSKNDLEVQKYGEDSTTKQQENVNFLLSNGVYEYGWAQWGNKVEENGVIIYSDVTFDKWTDYPVGTENKQVFTTGERGFIVKQLSTGYSYALQETWNEHEGYTNIDIKSATLSNGEASIALESTTGDAQTKNLIKGIKLSSSQENILQIIDRKRIKPANLTVNKYGEDYKGQANVRFLLIQGEAQKKYAKWESKKIENNVAIYSGITYMDYVDEATAENFAFETGGAGLIIQELGVTDVYSMQEYYNPNTGYNVIDIKEAKLNNGIANVKLSNTDQNNTSTKNLITGIQLSNATENILQIVDKLEGSKDDFKIHIDKIDNTNDTPVGNAEFKIKVSGGNQVGWLHCVNPKDAVEQHRYEIRGYDEATTWNTKVGNNSNSIVYAKEKGVLDIPNLSAEHTYQIFEFQAGDGCLNLRSQVYSGMTVTIESNLVNAQKTTMNYNTNFNKAGDDVLDNSIKCGSVSYKDYGAVVNLEIVNVTGSSTTGGNDPEYVDISGIVWIDNPFGKQDEYNNIYDSGDDNVLNSAEAEVILRKSSNKAQVGDPQKLVNGTYTFKKEIYRVTSDTLSDYYVELSYNNIDPTDSDINPKYRIVESGEGEKASQAKFQSPGKAWTGPITITSSLHMNIGLVALPVSTQSVKKEVNNIRVVANVNGERSDCTYVYGKNNTGQSYVGEVFVGNDDYYRTIYASDLIYSYQDKKIDEIEVYITYEITVTNLTSTWQTKEQVGNIKEDYMTVTLTDEYNSDYYEFADDIDKWDVSTGTGTAKYKTQLKLYRKGNGDKKKPFTTTIPITFKLTEKALEDILKNGSFTEGNKASISGNHTYKEYEYIGEEDIYDWYRSGRKMALWSSRN